MIIMIFIISSRGHSVHFGSYLNPAVEQLDTTNTCALPLLLRWNKD